MSMEIAKAFCARMMSDEDFRNQLLQVKDVAEVEKLVGAEYKFSKDDLAKVIGEFVGHKLAEGELEKLVCEFFEEQTENKDACKVIIAWVSQLA